MSCADDNLKHWYWCEGYLAALSDGLRGEEASADCWVHARHAALDLRRGAVRCAASRFAALSASDGRFEGLAQYVDALMDGLTRRRRS